MVDRCQLKDICQAVTYPMMCSSGSWDDDLGTNIMTDADKVVWAGIVASHPILHHSNMLAGSCTCFSSGSILQSQKAAMPFI
jgi:hypothetical protein